MHSDAYSSGSAAIGGNPEEETPQSIIAGSNSSALSMVFSCRQLPEFVARSNVVRWVEKQLEKERDQLPLWSPVAFGSGIAFWFLLADPLAWLALILLCVATMLIVARTARKRRLAGVIFWIALLTAAGCLTIWLRSWAVATPVLERPVVTTFYAEIERSEFILSRDQVRLVLDTRGKAGLPPRVRVNVPANAALDGLQPGAIIELRARLMPPAISSLPGAYNFAERAWFQGLGATGQLLGEARIVESASGSFDISNYRQRLSEHVQSRMSGGAAAIGATLATGDRGAITDEDAEAMRNSGLAHLLSISGLHVTAIVGAVYLIVLKFLAAFPPLALRWRLPLFAAGCAAIAALAYTLMTGAQVPTVRACIAALLVLAALMLGRSALTLRMVAAGALFVLIIWPEVLIGPSFQLSFAAVTSIIALHEHPRMRALLAPREEGYFRRIRRVIISLFLTGLAVEIALMPIALYHFHKAGLYGAFANIIAIPLTTFVIMPMEALALFLDSFGLGAPAWWICEKALQGLIALAHFVSSSPGAVTLFPTMPIVSFGLILAGGLWIFLWKDKWRLWGGVPLTLGLLIMALTRPADILVTGDGRHVGIRNADNEFAMLRTRSGDFIRSMLLESAGVKGEPANLDDWPGANCNRDSCTVVLFDEGPKGGRKWTLLAMRSTYYLPALALSAACQRADIVVSERRLPESCKPRWIKADRTLLRQTGGLTIHLASGKIETVRERSGDHIWMRFKSVMDQRFQTD
ncbi:ComEC/Rec2 family competence protein [Parasphingorhabdus sp.]|uniref:ComEC/Rec2 family competence protein n=1 Tax=Parasphingorhabdus sp. TaxID=2709688 RepID=UPI003265EF64